MAERPSSSPKPDDPLVVFLPAGRRGRVPAGTSLLAAARQLGVDLDSVCGGRGICGRCQVRPSLGEHPKLGITCSADRLTPVSAPEEHYDRRKGLASDRRLACHTRVQGDAVVDVPPESQVHKQIVRKRPDTRTVEIDPVVRPHYVEMTPPTIGDQRSDVRRLSEALETQWGLAGLTFDPPVLRALAQMLRDGEWTATAAVRGGARVVALWPGFRERLLGLAVDVGTTTIAVHVCDLADGGVIASAGAMNPQIRFGEDVISRISYVQSDDRHLRELTAAARQAIAHLVGELATENGFEPHDILEVAIVGNPAMHHILLGLDPRHIGRAPFTLVVDDALTVPARELGLPVNAGARAYALPLIAGHVGADTAGVLLSEAPHRSRSWTLLIDVGTNAEIVLGNDKRLFACSSPTGPAFEGGQISCGQRAAPGAIERVRIDPGTLVPRFKVLGCGPWSDEPGFAEALGDTAVTGLCGSGIIEAVAEMHMAGLIDASGRLDETRLRQSPNGVVAGNELAYRLHDGPTEVQVTQTDIRNIQLAKAALYAGARLLMDRAGVDRVERIVLAGAFGSYIDPRHAMALGMIPDCPLDKVSAAGNAAGTGARIALLSRRARTEIEGVVRGIEKLETASEPNFQSYFVSAMTIPHRQDTFPHLEGAFSDDRAGRFAGPADSRASSGPVQSRTDHAGGAP